MNNLPSELFDLIESKNYDQLTAAERALIMEHMSEAEYMDQRNIILDFRAIDDQLVFDERDLPQRFTRRSLIQRLINYRVPLYQVAASIAIVSMVTYAITSSTNDAQNMPYDSGVHSGHSVADGYYPDSLVFNL